jgi:demethylmenaquinone methyltransferase/2-methoxy-6-polyprenyl-1,4-benzoquinol methylase
MSDSNSPGSGTADLDRALHHYGELAPRYDYATRRIDGVRAKAIAKLRLQPGDVVLDAGCGTGFCFAMIEQAIGPRGKLIGMEPSPEMIARGKGRVDDARWTNATLLCTTGEAAELPHAPDAILFSFTHDLLQSRSGLDNLFRQARPGARVVATGSQLFPRWFFPGNWYLHWSHRGYITNFAAFDAPWRVLSGYLSDFRVARQWPGERYIATGRLNGRSRDLSQARVPTRRRTR